MSIEFNEAVAAAVDRKNARITELEGALKDLIHGYVMLLESARDRIVSLGGQCDSVDSMERADHHLRTAKKKIGL